MMKLVFCGTPAFAVPTLNALVAAGHDVALVLTQPDRPAGRNLAIQASPVSVESARLGLETIHPEKLKSNEELKQRLIAIVPDAIVVVAYGRIIPKWMLDLPHFGNINLHGSLLPKYRGAAPVQWAIANGETETGVTTMWLDEGLDTGDVLLERKLTLAPDATSPVVLSQLAVIGAELMVETLRGLLEATITRKSQPHALATLAPILTREDGHIDFTERTAQEIYNRWRAFQPWPGAFASLRGKRFLIHRMRIATEASGLACGDLDWASGDLLVGAAEGSTLVLEEVQIEGKGRLSGMDFVRGFQLKQVDRLD
jgi:methionyl-tRNA formyltransferase